MTTLETTKSASETRVAENGKISRGKDTFDTRFGLLVRELVANRNDDAKKFQANSPVYAKSGYGIPASIGATRVKITENTIVFTSGMKIAHPNPITVCLYRSSKSRLVI